MASTVEIDTIGKEIKMGRKKKGRSKKRERKKTVGILLCVTAFVTIIILSAWYQRNSYQPKKPADEYFSFLGLLALAEPLDSENSSIRISQVGFTITATGGKATNIFVYPLQGMVADEDIPFFEEIPQGKSVEVGITYPVNVVSDKEENGYPVDFRIISNEAEGKVKVYITEFLPLQPF